MKTEDCLESKPIAAMTGKQKPFTYYLQKKDQAVKIIKFVDDTKLGDGTMNIHIKKEDKKKMEQVEPKAPGRIKVIAIYSGEL